jgi:LmbE family N-acetylglucosaminyl deacetylase
VKNKRVLIIAPHPDDGEFGCGGTIRKWTENGAEVFYAVLSPCLKSVPEGFDKDVLYRELHNAAPELGIEPQNIITFDFEVREFARDRQLILESFVKLRKEIQPDIVLLPNSKDIHQDHGTVHMEGLRAFKHATMLGYDLPWNYTELNVSYFELLEERHIRAKMDAIAHYKSQQFRSYVDFDFFKGMARMRGIQAGSALAEGFEVLKIINN